MVISPNSQAIDYYHFHFRHHTCLLFFQSWESKGPNPPQRPPWETAGPKLSAKQAGLILFARPDFSWYPWRIIIPGLGYHGWSQVVVPNPLGLWEKTPLAKMALVLPFKKMGGYGGPLPNYWMKSLGAHPPSWGVFGCPSQEVRISGLQPQCTPCFRGTWKTQLDVHFHQLQNITPKKQESSCVKTMVPFLCFLGFVK